MHTVHTAPAQEKVMEAVRQADRPIQPKEIEERTGLTRDSVNSALRKLKDQGRLVQPGYGLYDLPENVESDEKQSGDRYKVVKNPAAPDINSSQGTTTHIPLVAIRVSAGPGEGLFEQRVESYMQFDQEQLKRQTGVEPSRVVILPINGDSMKGTVDPGDFVMVEKMNGGPILDGSVYVFRSRQRGAVIKRAYWEDANTLRLTSDNESGPELHITPEDDDDWECVGRFVRVIKPL